MADHHPPPPPPPPRINDLYNTTQILNQTTTTIFSSRHFLILSFFLFSLRTSVEKFTLFITTHIDNNPEIETLVSRLQPPPNPSPISTSRNHRHRPPFQLSRLRILEDDYEHEFDNEFWGKSSKLPKLNATSFILDSFHPQFGFSDFNSDSGIRVSEIVRSSVTTSFRTFEIAKKVENNTALIDDGIGKNESKTNLLYDHLERHEWNLIGVFYAIFWAIFLAYVFTHVWVHGVVFVVVVNHFLNRNSQFGQTFKLGAKLGSRRVTWFVIFRWLVRNGWIRTLGRWFFGEIDGLFYRENGDQYSGFKILIRLLLLPFSTVSDSVSPWMVKGFEQEIYAFLLTWFLLDALLSFLFALHPWVAMGDKRRTWREVIDEGCDLLTLEITHATKLKCLEVLASGSVARDILTHMFGNALASMIQCFAEVYFMVAWMMLYLYVKSFNAWLDDVPFGNRELEAMLEND